MRQPPPQPVGIADQRIERQRRDDDEQRYRARSALSASTRSSSEASRSSASASIGPPHTVSRSGITMRFDARIKSLQRRMQQEGAAFVLGEIAVLRHQQEIRLQADDGFQRGKAAELVAEIGARHC